MKAMQSSLLVLVLSLLGMVSAAPTCGTAAVCPVIEKAGVRDLEKPQAPKPSISYTPVANEVLRVNSGVVWVRLDIIQYGRVLLAGEEMTLEAGQTYVIEGTDQAQYAFVFQPDLILLLPPLNSALK